MADLLDAQHIDAGLELLWGTPDLTVYPDENGLTPPAGEMADHYVRVYGHVEWPKTGDGNTLDGRSVTCHVRWYAHCVGPNPNSARAVRMLVRSALLNARPSVPNRSLGLIEHEAGQPIDRDPSGPVEVFKGVDVYFMVSMPG